MQRHRSQPRRFVSLLVGVALVSLGQQLRAGPGYSAKSGTIEFSVGSNTPLIRVRGSSSAICGGGEATLHGNSATIRNLRFELDPKTLTTGLALRDKHMYEKVFSTSAGTMPMIALRASEFEAKENPQTHKWEGNFRAEVMMRGVTRPVPFRATAERRGDSAVVHAEGTVRISEFGVAPIRYLATRVDDEVAVVVRDLVIAR